MICNRCVENIKRLKEEYGVHWENRNNPNDEPVCYICKREITDFQPPIHSPKLENGKMVKYIKRDINEYTMYLPDVFYRDFSVSIPHNFIYSEYLDDDTSIKSGIYKYGYNTFIKYILYIAEEKHDFKLEMNGHTSQFIDIVNHSKTESEFEKNWCVTFAKIFIYPYYENLGVVRNDLLDRYYEYVKYDIVEYLNINLDISNGYSPNKSNFFLDVYKDINGNYYSATDDEIFTLEKIDTPNTGNVNIQHNIYILNNNIFPYFLIDSDEIYYHIRFNKIVYNKLFYAPIGDTVKIQIKPNNKFFENKKYFCNASSLKTFKIDNEFNFSIEDIKSIDFVNTNTIGVK